MPKNSDSMDIKRYKETVYEVIGAAMTVHKELGYGLQEGIYNESLCLELQDRHIDAESEVELLCYYKGRQLQKKYRMDIVVGDIIVELKSVSKILDEHRAQLFNYLRLTKKPVGLLVNFGVSGLMCERYAFDESCNECILLDKNMNPFY